jgi:hypothetical protein
VNAACYISVGFVPLFIAYGFRAYVLEHNLGMVKTAETKFYYLCCLTGIADFI